MHSVKVKKGELINRVQANRDGHRKTYEKAYEGYRKQLAAFFEEQHRRVIAGEEFATVFPLPEPEDHTEDYDRVLDMLSMSVADEIDLDQREFAQYVRDDWGWSQMFAMTSANYLK